MKVLFVVQGEGRGHLTQAMAMQRLLQKDGHQVVGVLVGKSNYRELPDFFQRAFRVPIQRFYSPNFLPTPKNKRISIPLSVAYNILETPTFLRSIWFLHKTINASGADIVINFYDILLGLTYFFWRPSVPQVSIGHQYLFLHEKFSLPGLSKVKLRSLNFFSRLTSLGAQERLALSFYPMERDTKHHIIVVPPLLREEVATTKVSNGDYIHGYMLNTQFEQSIRTWHRKHKDVPMRFFWDKKGAKEVTKVDSTLEFHKLDDHKFLQSLAGSKGYATTAGFESVCEAMYFGKPILMVPAHIEQACNAADACRAGAGVQCETFDFDKLLPLLNTYKSKEDFRQWVDTKRYSILPVLERVASEVPCYPLSLAWFRSL